MNNRISSLKWQKVAKFFLLVATLFAATRWILLPLMISFIELPQSLTSPAPKRHFEITDRNGIPLREVHEDEGYSGERLQLQQISDHLIKATLAAEDRRFWKHEGVDLLSTCRACWSLVKNRRIISGASTITMQLVKISNPRPRTFKNKFIEMAQAMKLEQVWSKQQILTEYLNRLDYGHLRLGIAAATRYFFNKSPSSISPAEAAFLAGIPQAPSRHSPYSNFPKIKKRQLWILSEMNKLQLLTPDDYARAVREPLRLQPNRRYFRAPHFADLFLQLEGDVFPSDRQNKVTTSLDINLNVFTENFLRTHLRRLQEHKVHNGAAVVIDNKSGEVLALVGSEDYFDPISGQVNGAWAPRSAGSTFKPFTYLIAFEQGDSPATVIADVPTEFATATGIFAPANYNNRCLGPVTYRKALANSLNIPAVKVLSKIGGPKVLRDSLAKLGLSTLNKNPEYYGLGLTIGNAEARLLELANAYACLARGGQYLPFSLIKRDSTPPNALKVFDSSTAWLVADILSDNTARTPVFGPNSSLRFDFPVACKTGTSSDYRDNWAFGYTPEFTVGVWVGNFDGQPMKEVSGVTGAAPIMHDIVEHLHNRFGTSWYATPSDIVAHSVHPLTGKRIRINRELPGMVREYFLSNHLPPTETELDYDDRGRVRLGSEYRDWLETAGKWMENLVALEPNPTGQEEIKIIAPLPGTIFYLDPDLPDQGSKLRLKAEGSPHLRWHSPTLRIETLDGIAYAHLKAGKHELHVVDDSIGKKAIVEIEVKSL